MIERIVAKGGRLRFEPTPEQRRDVEMMAALGIPPEQMCQIVRNKNEKPIRLRTFLRHFRQEIETGAIKVNASVVSFIIATVSISCRKCLKNVRGMIGLSFLSHTIWDI